MKLCDHSGLKALVRSDSDIGQGDLICKHCSSSPERCSEFFHTNLAKGFLFDPLKQPALDLLVPVKGSLNDKIYKDIIHNCELGVHMLVTCV